MLESLFNKVAGLTLILKNIFQRLLLHYTRTTHCYHGVIRFTFTFFLIITTTIVNISNVCFLFKLKRLQRIRSSHRRCFIIKGVLINFAKFTGKQLCQSLFFNKLVLKKILWHRCFSVNFAKFLRTTFLTEHLWVTASVRMKNQINVVCVYFNPSMANVIK